MRMSSAALVGLSLLFASAAPAAPQAEVAARSVRFLTVINAGLQTGATNARMLEELSRSAKIYDSKSGLLLLANIRSTVDQAAAQVDALKALVAGDAEAQRHLTQISSRLEHARSLASGVDSRNPAAAHAVAAQLFNDLDGGLDPLESLSSHLDAAVDLEPRD